jgi:manganese transport system substrate-binding protein
VAVAVALAVLAPAGCGGSSDESDDGKPRVLTTFTVIADMARQVGGDRVNVASITKPGAEIHGYEPTPSDLRRAAGADLVLYNGLGLERWFEQFIDQSGADSAILTEGVESIPIEGSSEYAGKPNPHAWMSTQNARIYVENIRKALTKLDPDGAQEYKSNADRYISQIDEVQRSLAAQLDDLPAGQRALVSCEGAFSYLARDFDLDEKFLWPVNAEQEGTPQQIASVVEFVRERDVPAVFCESTVSNEAQKQVARESGAKFGGVLFVDSLSKAGGPVPTYIKLLDFNSRAIARGLRDGR